MVVALLVEGGVEVGGDGAGVGDEVLHRGGTAALAVAPELGDEEVDAVLVVEADELVVVAHDLAVAVEVEDRRVLRPGLVVEARADRDAAVDLDQVVGRALRRAAGIGSREERHRAHAEAVEQGVVGFGCGGFVRVGHQRLLARSGR